MIAKSVIIKRSVVSLQEGQVVVEETPEPEDADRVPSADEVFYQKFWEEFLGSLRLDDPSQPMAKVTKVGNAFFQMPPSSSQAWLTVYFLRARNEVGVFLTFVRGGFGDVAYPRLLEERDEIERQLGVEVSWKAMAPSMRLRLANLFRISAHRSTGMTSRHSSVIASTDS